jgi:hypothetical protein
MMIKIIALVLFLPVLFVSRVECARPTNNNYGNYTHGAKKPFAVGQQQPKPHASGTVKKHSSNFWITQFDIHRNPETDVIGNKPAQYYLKHPKVARLAKNFYYGRFRPTDNDSTAQLLNLVTTANSEIRPFYRWCLNETINMADGALAEYPGGPAFNYVARYPTEFFTYMDSDKSGQRFKNWKQMISYSGLPLYHASNAKLEQAILTRLMSNCSACSLSTKQRIHKMAKDLVSLTQSR